MNDEKMCAPLAGLMLPATRGHERIAVARSGLERTAQGMSDLERNAQGRSGLRKNGAMSVATKDEMIQKETIDVSLVAKRGAMNAVMSAVTTVEMIAARNVAMFVVMIADEKTFHEMIVERGAMANAAMVNNAVAERSLNGATLSAAETRKMTHSGAELSMTTENAAEKAPLAAIGVVRILVLSAAVNRRDQLTLLVMQTDVVRIARTHAIAQEAGVKEEVMTTGNAVNVSGGAVLAVDRNVSGT